MTISRRQLLLGTAGLVTGACTGSVAGSATSAAKRGSSLKSQASAPASQTGSVTPSENAPVRHSYGSSADQFGELSLPSVNRRQGTIIIIHGGFWRAQYTLDLGRPLAADLVRRGYAVWNLEYRRVGGGGGWPNTLADVAAGIDVLADLDVDTSAVCAIGHSAGGQLAAWSLARAKLPPELPGARPKVTVTAAVAQAGVLDLITAVGSGVGGTAVSDFLGGTPAEVPEHYTAADPTQLLPVLAPVLCVHGRDDDTVPLSQSQTYVRTAHRTGSRATLHEVDGDHFTLIDPTSAAWQVVVDALPGLLHT
jgi:acetyl esterase/lipase